LAGDGDLKALPADGVGENGGRAGVQADAAGDGSGTFGHILLHRLLMI
jgi:hypothetical protein